MSQSLAFPYLSAPLSRSPRPWLPVRLLGDPKAFDEFGLVDSAADVSILPFALGHRLGLKWSSAIPVPSIGGALQSTPAREASLDAIIANWPPIRLIFAPLQRDAVPLILGQTNFFQEFDVCFFGSKQEFQVQPRTP
jgi:hypothetical protein